MKTQDLRIGNYVFDQNAQIAKVFSVSQRNTLRISTETYTAESRLIEECSSIPLTEEWLSKAGFKKVGRLFYHESFRACELSKYGELYFEDLECYINYVHQLQNLYFAKTGEELKFINLC